MALATAWTIAFGAWAETEKVGDYTWTYRINGDTAEIYGSYNNGYVSCISPLPTGGTVIIPSMLGGKPVTSIGNDAFCDEGEGVLWSVKIPDSVTTIGDYAFAGCCLWRIIIPDSVTKIGMGAFESCYYLQNVIFGNGVKTIEDYAFRYCDNLKSITIPDNVTSIGTEAFEGCAGLIRVSIGNNVTVVGEFAFYDANLATVSAPEGLRGRLEEADAYIFSNTPAIAYRATADESEFYIEGGVLMGVVPHGTGNVSIPAGVASIDADAFWGCRGPMSVVIPDGVKSVESYLFEDCIGLTSVTIPASVTGIGKGAFWGCSGLEKVIYLGNAPDTEADIYYGTPRALVSYVQAGSLGWAGGLSGTLPENWNDRAIVREGSSPVVPPGTVVMTNIVTVTMTNTVTERVAITNIIEIAQGAAMVPEVVRTTVPEVAFTGADTMKMNGVVFDAEGTMCGIIQVETGKATVKGVKVKGFMMFGDGKKVALKAVTVSIESGRLSVETLVGKLGTINIIVGGDGFKGTFGTMKVASADIENGVGVLTGSLTLKYIGATGKVNNRKIMIGGIATDGTAAGTITPKGGRTQVFAAEFE